MLEAAHRIEAALAELRAVASAGRHGDQLAAVLVDAHAAGFRRLRALAADEGALLADPDLAEVLWVHEAAGDGAAIETMGTRVDALRAAIEQCGVPGLVAAADELVDAVIEVHGWALGRAIEILHATGQGEVLTAALVDDLIGALLLAHGMHPEPLAERVERVLAACATTLGSHAGVITLVEADEDRARVRVAISGGDEQQRWRTRLSVERAVRDLVADVVDLQIDGADREPARGTPDPTIIPVTAIGRRRSTQWKPLPVALSPGDVVRLEVDGRALVACRVGNDHYVAADPFATNSLRLVATAPPTIEAGDGTRFVFADPLPTHVDGDLVEVLL